MVLNAKQHEREAEYVAQAGRLGMVTIATNMAGRGTDILLGGNPEFMARQEMVKKGRARAHQRRRGCHQSHGACRIPALLLPGPGVRSRRARLGRDLRRAQRSRAEGARRSHRQGGLFILGTERHESRRIDNQLRGRAGRQGDPGASRFYLSLEDDLMRIFAKQWVSTLLERLGMEEGVPIESKMISNRIEGAQKAVESQNFESRKHLLEYDDVMNKQREAVYGLRRQLLEGVDQRELILEDYVGGILSGILDEFAPEDKHPDQWNIKGMDEKLMGQFGFSLSAAGIRPQELARHELGDADLRKAQAAVRDRKSTSSARRQMRYHERMVMLSVIDGLWKDHLLSMDHLKEGIGLRGYAQQDPLVAYKRESFDMFEAMMAKFQEDTVRFLFRMQILGPDGRPIDAAAGAAPSRSACASRGQRRAVNTQWRWPAHICTMLRHARDRTSPRAHLPQPSTQLEKEFPRKKQRELEAATRAGGGNGSQPSQRRTGEKVGRNDPCPCGSGKKYKKCHGAEA